MKAMILAAGYGKRLKPLTDTKPKALIEVAGKPMLHWVAEKLVNNGFDRIVINVHHHASMIKQAVKKLPFKAEFIISDEEDRLLGTGGGLLKAKKYLCGSEPFLVYNVDIISNINLQGIYSSHLKQGCIATLATSVRDSSNYLLWHNNKLVGWEHIESGKKIIAKNTTEMPLRKAFSGIHVISPRIFDLVKESGNFSIINVYLELAKEKEIFSFDHDHKYWFDLGTVEKIRNGEKVITKNHYIFVQ